MHERKQFVADPVATALRALAWTLAEQARADRMLALTGLGAGDLRTRAADRAVLAAVLAFLEAHEPDLIACAAALDLPPSTLALAREVLEE